jgi:hypothetical protein
LYAGRSFVGKPTDTAIAESGVDLSLLGRLTGTVSTRSEVDFSILLEVPNRPALFGFWMVIFVTGVLVAVVAMHRLVEQKRISVYRPYEQALLDVGRLRLNDLLSYHGQFQWGTYASITVGMVLISVSMLAVNIQDLSQDMATVHAVGVLVLTVAVILLASADLVHTNSQTPIIPVSKRFDLIDVSVGFGTLGAMLTILGLLLFVSTVSLHATFVACVAFGGVSWSVERVRRIPKKEFESYFGVGLSDASWIRAFGSRKVDPWSRYAAVAEREALYAGVYAAAGFTSPDGVLGLLGIPEEAAQEIRSRMERNRAEPRALSKLGGGPGEPRS